MEIKEKKSAYKQKKFNEKLENSSKVFTLLGLVLALFVVYVFMEYETKQVHVKFLKTSALVVDNEYSTSILFLKQALPKEIVTKKSNEKVVEIRPEILDLVKPVPDHTKLPEGLYSEEITDVNIDSITVVDIPEVIEDDFPLMLVDKAPVFPGCIGNSNELRACLAKKIKKHVNKKFNSGLGQEVGLSSGKKRIFVIFKIDALGNITDIKARAPHPSLKKEAERVIKLLPKMKPGKKEGRPVGVRYSIPIVLDVQ